MNCLRCSLTGNTENCGKKQISLNTSKNRGLSPIFPLAFVANPALLYPGAHLGLAMLAFAKVAVGLWLMSRALIGGKAPAWTAPLFLLVGLAAIFAVGIDP